MLFKDLKALEKGVISSFVQSGNFEILTLTGCDLARQSPYPLYQISFVTYEYS